MIEILVLELCFMFMLPSGDITCMCLETPPAVEVTQQESVQKLREEWAGKVRD